MCTKTLSKLLWKLSTFKETCDLHQHDVKFTLTFAWIKISLQHSSNSGNAGNSRHCLRCFLLCTIVNFFSSMLLHSLSSGKGGRFLLGRRGTMHSVAKLFCSLQRSMSTSGGITRNVNFTNIIFLYRNWQRYFPNGWKLERLGTHMRSLRCPSSN